MSDVLTAHRALYDAVESGDADLMASLWVDADDTSCVHPGAPLLRGTTDVLRSWTVLMAQIGYIQFFLTDVEVTTLPIGAAEPETAVITCTENILSGEPEQAGVPASVRTFGAGTALSTSVLIRGGSAGTGWKFLLRHASPAPQALADPALTDPEET